MRNRWLASSGRDSSAAGAADFHLGSVGGARTRRYHGLLVAALRPPVERTVLVAKIDATASYRGESAALGGLKAPLRLPR